MKHQVCAAFVLIFTVGPLTANAADVDFELVGTPQEIKAAVADLQHDLVRNVGGGRISSCLTITSEGFGRGFTALGAACNVTFGQKTTRWIICNDDGVGNFVAEVGVVWQTGPPSKPQSSHLPAQVATFAHDNCAHG